MIPARCRDCGTILPGLEDADVQLLGQCAQCAGWAKHLVSDPLMARPIAPRKEMHERD